MPHTKNDHAIRRRLIEDDIGMDGDQLPQSVGTRSSALREL
jgi:hypothetical protein